MLYNLAKKNYDKFLVPTSEVSALKTKRYNTTIHKTDLDKKTSVNKIGEIVNLSQILNSVLWEFKKFNQNYDEIYLDICKLSVMSNIAIDMAKKEFDINLEIELNELRNKYKEYVKNKPLFFYTLPVPDRFKKSKDKYKIYATSMDYLIQSFDKIGNKTKKSREETINIIDLFKKVKNSNEKNRNYQIITILNLIIQYKTNCNLIWKSNLENNDKYFKSLDLKIELIENIKKIKINSSTLYNIIKNADKRIQRTIIGILFEAKKEEFIKLIDIQKEKISFLYIDKNGNIEIFGIKFLQKW